MSRKMLLSKIRNRVIRDAPQMKLYKRSEGSETLEYGDGRASMTHFYGEHKIYFQVSDPYFNRHIHCSDLEWNSIVTIFMDVNDGQGVDLRAIEEWLDRDSAP